MARLTFFGGAGGVTGSKHLLEVADKRILLDCGTFQGLPDVRERNRSFPFSPESIDAVILSHAHIDHSGMLPLLVKRGFNGPIYATPATRDVVRFMLEDAAGIEEQDADYRRRHHVGPPDAREPLFTREDVGPTLKQFVGTDYVRNGGGWLEVAPGIRLKFYDAGHILGSAISVLETEAGTLAYSGDLGPLQQPLLHDPEVPAETIESLILESTYGSHRHADLSAAEKALASAIGKVCERGGKIIVPAFSLGRTQTFVYVVHKLTDQGAIPRFPIFVDSPLATDLTEVHRAHTRDYDSETLADFPGDDHGPLAFRNLRYVMSREESKALNSQAGPFMVISASGMMTAGRVVHHLRHSVADARNAIFITGYQAQGTPGRQLLEGATKIELYGDMFPVKAETFLFNEFSAHADSQELQVFAEKLSGLRQVFLVHGEPSQADDLKNQLAAAHPDWKVTRPNEGEVVELG